MIHPLERVPAVRRLATDREDAFAFEITGFVTTADAENLVGLLEGAYELSDRLDLLFRIVDFEGTEWRQVDSETKKEGREHALAHVNRCAVVCHRDLANVPDAFLVDLLKLEMEHFEPENEAEAWAWIEASETRE